MKSHFTVRVFFLFFLFTLTTFAGPKEDVAQAKLETSFFKLSKSIEPSLHLLWEANSSDQQIEEQLDKPTRRYIEEVISQLPTDESVKKNFLKKTVELFHWKSWKEIFLNKRELLLDFVKRQGALAVATASMVVVHDIVLAAVATHIGHPELIPMILWYPSTFIIHSSNMKIYNFYQKTRMAKYFGGFREMKLVYDEWKQVERDLKIKSTKDILLSFRDPTSNEMRGLIARTSNFYNRFFLKSSDFTLLNFVHYLKRQKLWNSEYEQIFASPSLLEDEKLFVLFKDFSSEVSLETWINFQLTFQKNFVVIKDLKSILNARSKLPKTISKLSEIAGLVKALQDFSPQTQWKLWNEYYLPALFINSSDSLGFRESKILTEASLKAYARSQNPNLNNEEASYFVQQFYNDLNDLHFQVENCSSLFHRFK